jgi:hypothetical protein
MGLLAGIYFLITHAAAYGQMVIVGRLASNIIIAYSIYKVATAKLADFRERAMRIAVFLLFNILAVFLYHIMRRKQLIHV